MTTCPRSEARANAGLAKKAWWWVKGLWWSRKLALFPHLERRTVARVSTRRQADDMLATALLDMTDAMHQGGKRK